MLSGAIWWKGVSQRTRAPLGGGLSQGRWQRLIGTAFLFLYGEGLTSLDNKRMARGCLIIDMHIKALGWDCRQGAPEIDFFLLGDLAWLIGPEQMS